MNSACAVHAEKMHCMKCSAMHEKLREEKLED
jgi:hypothetical protein